MMKKEENSDDIVVNYYEGAYGPTIRINTRSVKSLAKIRDLFGELATAKISEVNFDEIGSVTVMGMKAFVLKLVPGKEHKRTLKLIRTTSEGIVFHWSRSSEGWIDCVGLVDGMLEHQHPAHQYLTDESVDDVLVEVAFMEI